jgi:hypothetical protein
MMGRILLYPKGSSASNPTFAAPPLAGGPCSSSHTVRPARRRHRGAHRRPPGSGAQVAPPASSRDEHHQEPVMYVMAGACCSWLAPHCGARLVVSVGGVLAWLSPSTGVISQKSRPTAPRHHWKCLIQGNSINSFSRMNDEWSRSLGCASQLIV